MLTKDQLLSCDVSRSTDFSPRGYLIRYPLLVSASVLRFVNDFQDDFKQLPDGSFKLAKRVPNKTLTELLTKYLDEERSRILSKAFYGLAPGHNDWFIVSDSGSLRRAFYKFPENDVDVGIERIEKIVDALFNRWMRRGNGDARIVWCKHKLLTSDDWESVCAAKVFGRRSFKTIDKCLLKGKQGAVEVLKELDPETKERLSKKETSQLIVKECADYVLEKIASFRSYSASLSATC